MDRKYSFENLKKEFKKNIELSQGQAKKEQVEQTSTQPILQDIAGAGVELTPEQHKESWDDPRVPKVKKMEKKPEPLTIPKKSKARRM